MLSTNKISSTILYILLAITVVVVAFFFGGGIVDPTVEMQEPIFTELMLYWVYVLLGLGIVSALVFGIAQFVAMVKDNPKKAFEQIGFLIAFAVILGLFWILGDGTPLKITGYGGTENVEFWLKLTDMYLFTIYLMLGGAILAIIGANVKKMLDK